jgi:putative FmdB family regulatory protein
MPIYDFVCSECQLEFEALVRAADTPVCPECGSAKVKKLLSLPAAPGKSKEIIAKARRQAAREGHFSNYSASERPRRK